MRAAWSRRVQSWRRQQLAGWRARPHLPGAWGCAARWTAGASGRPGPSHAQRADSGSRPPARQQPQSSAAQQAGSPGAGSCAGRRAGLALWLWTACALAAEGVLQSRQGQAIPLPPNGSRASRLHSAGRRQCRRSRQLAALTFSSSTAKQGTWPRLRPLLRLRARAGPAPIHGSQQSVPLRHCWRCRQAPVELLLKASPVRQAPASCEGAHLSCCCCRGWCCCCSKQGGTPARVPASAGPG